MKNIFKLSVGIVVLAICCILIYFLSAAQSYDIFKFFPLNENDKYFYDYHEGIVQDTLTLTVKNVKLTKEGKQFMFFWQGKDNNRTQEHLLTSQGLIFHRNEHLEGEAPLRSIRICSPALVMIPSKLSKGAFFKADYLTYDCDIKGKLLSKEKIDAIVSFIGKENVYTEAGEFKCLHFFVRHNYKDDSGNSVLMHTYNFWIAEGIGIIKMVHTLVPLVHIDYFTPEKRPFNRYSTIFSEVSVLKKAYISGKMIGDNE